MCWILKVEFFQILFYRWVFLFSLDGVRSLGYWQASKNFQSFQEWLIQGKLYQASVCAKLMRKLHNSFFKLTKKETVMMWNLSWTAFVNDEKGNHILVSLPLNLSMYTLPCLNLSWQRFLSYRNQSIDFQRKSMDWFLYDRDIHHEGLKLIPYHFPLLLQCFPVICSLKVSRVFGLIQKSITQNLWILT